MARKAVSARIAKPRASQGSRPIPGDGGCSRKAELSNGICVSLEEVSNDGWGALAGTGISTCCVMGPEGSVRRAEEGRDEIFSGPALGPVVATTVGALRLAIRIPARGLAMDFASGC